MVKKWHTEAQQMLNDFRLTGIWSTHLTIYDNCFEMFKHSRTHTVQLNMKTFPFSCKVFVCMCEIFRLKQNHANGRISLWQIINASEWKLTKEYRWFLYQR